MTDKTPDTPKRPFVLKEVLSVEDAPEDMAATPVLSDYPFLLITLRRDLADARGDGSQVVGMEVGNASDEDIDIMMSLLR